MTENGEFKGRVGAEIDHLGESDKIIYRKLEQIEEKVDQKFSSIFRIIYVWNGSLTVGGMVGAYLAIKFIDHLCGR